MATRLYGVSLGETPDNVAEGVGSAVSADDVELTVDLANSPTREQVLLSIENIKQYIIENIWPPA